MSENNTVSGNLQIADEVIASIAGTAVLEAEGVAGMAGYFTGDIASKLSRKKPAKGVSLHVENENVSVSVEIVVKSGVKVQDVAKDVQQKVKTAIETMTSFNVDEVHVHVTGLVA
jgi:uncharacterized alkaline shock family protein YloU